MSTEVEIFNSAMDILGSATITSFSENSKEAKLGFRNYPKVRRTLLESHYWNFAMKRIELALDSGTPKFGYTYSHTLPADCLRVRQTDDNGVKFIVQGRMVLSNNAAVMIEYISDVTDTSLFNASFEDALANAIAAKLAYPMTKSRTVARDQHSLAKELKKDAWSMDGQEGDMDDYQEDVWLESRQGGISGIGANKVVP